MRLCQGRLYKDSETLLTLRWGAEVISCAVHVCQKAMEFSYTQVGVSFLQMHPPVANIRQWTGVERSALRNVHRGLRKDLKPDEPTDLEPFSENISHTWTGKLQPSLQCQAHFLMFIHTAVIPELDAT